MGITAAGLAVSSGTLAPPMLTEMPTPLASAPIRAATDSASPRATPGRMTANSSPPIPRNRVVLAQGVREHRREPPQGLVPGGVPQGVVDVLEPVDVQHQHREGGAAAPGPRLLVLQALLEDAALCVPVRESTRASFSTWASSTRLSQTSVK